MNWKRPIVSAVPVLALFSVWELLSRTELLDSLLFPPPSVLLAAAWGMLASGELPAQIRATMTRTLAGCLIGSLLGFFTGLLMGGVRMVRWFLEPVVSALNSTPKLTLLPMAMLFLGIGDAARVALIAASAFIVLAIHAVDAARSVQASYVELAVNYGARRRDLLRRVYLPAALPQVFTGLRIALGRALVITVSVEIVGSSDGLGSMIWLAWQTLTTEKLYVGVLVTASIGALLHGGLQRLEGLLIPWKRTANAR